MVKAKALAKALVKDEASLFYRHTPFTAAVLNFDTSEGEEA